MGNIILIIILVYFAIISFYTLFLRSYLVVGTISSITVEEQKKLSAVGYKILHADNLRNTGIDYEKASKKIFIYFILKSILFKRVALFTSDPRFLKLRWRILLNVFINVRVVDSRVKRSKNLEWAKNLSVTEALTYLPKYFNQGKKFKAKSLSERFAKEALQRISVFLEELKRYSDDRFLPEKIWGGEMGGILQHD